MWKEILIDCSEQITEDFEILTHSFHWFGWLERIYYILNKYWSKAKHTQHKWKHEYWKFNTLVRITKIILNGNLILIRMKYHDIARIYYCNKQFYYNKPKIIIIIEKRSETKQTIEKSIEILSWCGRELAWVSFFLFFHFVFGNVDSIPLAFSNNEKIKTTIAHTQTNKLNFVLEH